MTSVSVALLPWRPSLRALSRCQHLAAQQDIVQDTIPEPVHLETGTPSLLLSLPVLSQLTLVVYSLLPVTAVEWFGSIN